MAFRTGAFAKVWELKTSDRGNYTDARISTSRKRKDTGEYEQDFGGYVRMIGEAHQMAAGLKSGDTIRLGDVSATQTYNRETGKTYTNFQVFTFEVPEPLPQRTQVRPQYDPSAEIANATEEELPFN